MTGPAQNLTIPTDKYIALKWGLAMAIVIGADFVTGDRTYMGTRVAALSVAFLYVMLRTRKTEERVLARLKRRSASLPAPPTTRLDISDRLELLSLLSRFLWILWVLLSMACLWASPVIGWPNMAEIITEAMIALAVFALPLRAGVTILLLLKY
jgi:hypothetical protein